MDVDSPNSLKRCSSAPHINNLLPVTTQMTSTQTTNTVSRDVTPTSFSNIFTPRARRFSASFSPLAVVSNGNASPNRNGGPRLNRISQLRQEECADVTNIREVNHEREVHSAMQMSQSYEDLTLVTENWSFSSNSNTNKTNDEPLHVVLPIAGSSISCSSPSPTSRTGGLRLPYHTLSPSPTRKTFATRRSMSPCAMRPSPLSSVKRKFDLDDNYSNCYSPPLKKIFTSERGSSPICQTPSPICPSPDSSTASFEGGSNPSCSGRVTPKLFVSKIFTPNINNSNNMNINSNTNSPPSSMMMMDCGVSSSSNGDGANFNVASSIIGSIGIGCNMTQKSDLNDISLNNNNNNNDLNCVVVNQTNS